MNASYQERLQKLKTILEEGNVVFFGGAGVSTESGIPDFRSTDGLILERNNPNQPKSSLFRIF